MIKSCLLDFITFIALNYCAGSNYEEYISQSS